MKRLFIIILFCLFHWQPSLAGVTEELEELRSQWIEAINSRSNDIQSLYRDDSVVFSEGQFLSGKEQISEYFSQSTIKIHSAEVIKTYKNLRNRYFETGTYKTENSKENSIHYVTIWFQNSSSTGQPRWLRELDIMYFQKGGNADIDTLDVARSQWNKLAMRRSASRMIKSLYTENAIYINKREVYNGRPSIITEYSTYIDSGYAVKLRPKHTVIVKPDITIDVGKYNAGGDFTGYYVQVWKQQSDKSWRVIFEAD